MAGRILRLSTTLKRTLMAGDQPLFLASSRKYLSVLVFVGLAACGGRIATEADAGTSDGGPCNTVDLLGDTITVIDVGAASALNIKGSPPPEGTYVLVGAGRFNGDSAGTHGTLSLTVQVTRDAWQVARSDDGAPVQRRTYEIGPANPTGYRLSGVCGTTESVLVWFLPINGPGFAFAIHDDASSIDWVSSSTASRSSPAPAQRVG